MNKTAMPSADPSPQGRDGSKMASGLKITEPTDREKLYTIDEQLHATINTQAPPFNFNDVLSKKVLRDQNLSFQKRTQYKTGMRDDWKDFVKDTSGNFFDTNKLYVKSLLDYKTRNYKHNKNTTD